MSAAAVSEILGLPNVRSADKDGGEEWRYYVLEDDSWPRNRPYHIQFDASGEVVARGGESVGRASGLTRHGYVRSHIATTRIFETEMETQRESLHAKVEREPTSTRRSPGS